MIKDKDRTPVAQDVISMCTKCKMELNHIVVAHNKDGLVERVKCYTCGSEHKYRISKKTSEKKPAKKRTTSRKADPEKGFERLAEKFADKIPVQYSMSGLFNNEDVIAHSIFGKGIVINTSYQKMEVMFADGMRLLAMDRK
jgi:hypothetical protein